MDALKLLTADHNRVRGLFARWKSAEEKGRIDEAIVLARTIKTELDVHAEIEETIFYPAIKNAGKEELSDIVAEGFEEHAVVKTLLTEIGQVEGDQETFVAKTKVLIENVEHHADEEEGEMFPLVRKALDATTLTDLAEQMEAKKRELGAPTLADKIDLAKADLERLAKEQEIPGRSKMTHEELAATVAPK